MFREISNHFYYRRGEQKFCPDFQLQPVIELVRSVAKDRDPEAAKKLSEDVPEFKGMMEDIAELGACVISKRLYQRTRKGHL